MLYVKIPKERVGVLIGPDGQTKKLIEERTGVRLDVDSETGDVTIIQKEEALEMGMVGLAARDIVKAIARGFSPERAMVLVNDEYYLEVVDIRDFTGKNPKHVSRVRARLIGTGGKTRRIIEDLSNAEMSVYGNTVSLIGDVTSMDVARRAVEMLLEGSEHSAVYRFLEGQRRRLKLMEMGMD